MMILNEFDRQVQNLIEKKYPTKANLTQEEFIKLLYPLKASLENIQDINVDIEYGKLPFVIVITSQLVPTEDAMSQVEKESKKGITKLFPHEPKDFKTIASEIIPNSHAYLLIDIDRGKETLNVPPCDALLSIREQNRIPLTIDEGVAIVTHYPDFLVKNNCFSLLASRNPKDKRVPAIWINKQKHPNLGWCWDGNPHTWLGSASAKLRI